MFARSAARRLARAALALSLGLGLAVPAMADGLRIQKSGKSRRAEQLAAAWLTHSPAHRAVLIATAQENEEDGTRA